MEPFPWDIFGTNISSFFQTRLDSVCQAATALCFLCTEQETDYTHVWLLYKSFQSKFESHFSPHSDVFVSHFLSLMSSDVRVAMKPDPFLRLAHTQPLSCDIMQLSPWRCAGDGPSLDNVKNVCLSLSICRFDFRLESCWEPEKIGAFGTPTPGL